MVMHVYDALNLKCKDIDKTQPYFVHHYPIIENGQPFPFSTSLVYPKINCMLFHSFIVYVFSYSGLHLRSSLLGATTIHALYDVTSGVD